MVIRKKVSEKLLEGGGIVAGDCGKRGGNVETDPR